MQMSALDAGLKSLDTGVSSQCAAAVDNLAGFYFKATHPEQPSVQPSTAAQVHKRVLEPPTLKTSRLVRRCGVLVTA